MCFIFSGFSLPTPPLSSFNTPLTLLQSFRLQSVIQKAARVVCVNLTDDHATLSPLHPSHGFQLLPGQSPNSVVCYTKPSAISHVLSFHPVDGAGSLRFPEWTTHCTACLRVVTASVSASPLFPPQGTSVFDGQLSISRGFRPNSNLRVCFGGHPNHDCLVFAVPSAWNAEGTGGKLRQSLC